MENRFMGSEIDLNPNKPAQKHQEDARKRAKEEDIQNPDRRKLLKYGALAGLGLALGVNIFKVNNDGGEKKEAIIESEDTETSLVSSKIISMQEDLKFIKKELEVKDINGSYRKRLSGKVPNWEKELNSLKQEILTEDEKVNAGVIFSRLEELEKKISIERLGLENNFHLGT